VTGPHQAVGRATAQIPALTAEQLDELPFPPQPVQDMLRLFSRAVRARQMYLPNNPVYGSSVEAVRTSFGPIWQQTDELTLTFSETEIKWSGAPVLVEATKANDSLPWTFFKDGIREIKLLSGFELHELDTVFEMLSRVRKAAPEEDDLLTMLWEADFTNLRYRYVDVGGEATAPLDGAPADVSPAAPDAVRAAVQEQAATATGVVNMQDFDATLYFLDENELTYLRREIEREYAGDLRQNVLAILFDIFESQPAPAIRAEVAELIETLMLLMLASGDLKSVAYVLAECQVAVSRGAQVTQDQRARLGQLPDRLSAPEPLTQLLQALDEAADLPNQEALTSMIGLLRAGALGTILSRLPHLRNDAVRILIESAATRLAAANTGELVKLVASKDAAVSLEAMRRSAAMKLTAAVPAIARVLAEAPASLRQAAIAALTAIDSPGAMQAMEKSIEDADRDVRIAAVRTLGAKAYRGVFARLEQAVKGKKLRDADLTERMAFFEAYGAMCGEAGVPFLDGILNGKGLFGGREEPEMRACAAIALGRITSRTAREALQKAAAEKDIVVRNAVTRALRGGKE